MFPFALYQSRYQKEQWRSPIFRDMILTDIVNRGPAPTVLDIGCGRGFDGDSSLQSTLAQAAGSYIGVEPDPTINPGPYFSPVHRCLFEDAPITPNSVDVGFAVMVLEHIPDPAPFWEKLGQVLKKGGVFWGITIDARHWFRLVSSIIQLLHVKETYLNEVLGRRGLARFEDYPTFYRCNTPQQVKRFAGGFSTVECASFAKKETLLFSYAPRYLWPLFRVVEKPLNRFTQAAQKAGLHLAIRACK
jgi:SAM-dependent methyltransferase